MQTRFPRSPRALLLTAAALAALLAVLCTAAVAWGCRLVQEHFDY